MNKAYWYVRLPNLHVGSWVHVRLENDEFSGAHMVAQSVEDNLVKELAVEEDEIEDAEGCDSEGYEDLVTDDDLDGDKHQSLWQLQWTSSWNSGPN